jgi:hypothetical protein
MLKIHTIASFAKPQPDTIAAIFLLKKFGEEHFPGVSEAALAFWANLPENTSAESLEQQGYILIDLGGSQFDHHTEREGGKVTGCASELVAERLGVTQNPALKKLLAYAKRDDLEGKGTISEDPLDRAFGLSGLLVNLNRTYSHDPAGVVQMVLAMFEAHYLEEENRTVTMKQEFKELQEQGLTTAWTIPRANLQPLRVVIVPTDNKSMAGWLRSYHRYDIVVLKLTSGHVNIISRQGVPLDLASTVASLRKAEASKLGIPVENLNLSQAGAIPEIQHWYYDTAANTLQNGGINPQATPPTSLTILEIRAILQETLAQFQGQ